jgi:hypothetical protein
MVADDALLKSIVEDNRAPMTPRSQIPPAQAKAEEPKPYTHGWVDPPKIRPPEGVQLVDELVDMQDKLDAAARARQMGLSHEEWARLSEKDIADRKAQQAKKAEGKK